MPLPPAIQDLETGGFELRETPLSCVLLGERDAFKLKRPRVSPHVDYGTLARRREACLAEVTLNRRTAPDVYHGIVSVTRAPDGRVRLGGRGEPLEWAVHMQRLPDPERADLRLRSGRLEAQALGLIAARLAAFHAEARSDARVAAYAHPEALAAEVRAGFARARSVLRAYLRAREAAEIEAWQLAFLERHGKQLEERVRSGRACEGHGDLRLEHVFIGTHIRIIDCLEFHERLRCMDVCADVAFLAADLAWHGRVDLAEQLADAYARESHDYGIFPWMDFFESTRACIRAHAAAWEARDARLGPRARMRAAHEARRFYLLALSASRRRLLPPAVVALGGEVASGKSTLADRIAAQLSAPVVVADRAREFLVEGDAPRSGDPAHLWEAFRPELPEQVYAEVLRRAAAVLDSGRPVVLDGCFRSRRMRSAARELARERDLPFWFIECRADAAKRQARLRQRARAAGVEPEAWLELAEALHAEWEPVTELPPSEHLVIDTGRPLRVSLERLERRLPRWPPGLRT